MLGLFTKVSNTLLSDAGFDVTAHLMKKLSRGFGKKETDGFINGDGVNTPVGILHPTEGAEVFKEVAAITYDDVIDFYFSLKSDYRAKGMWLMNDATALALKKLKDADGNYLWKGDENLLLGKKVEITEAMPDGTISLGDFSYYWVVPRKRLIIKYLREIYVLQNKTGYITFEIIDGRLTRREAVKTLKTTV